MTPAEIVDLLVARGPELRKAGVLELRIDGLRVAFAPHVDALPDVGSEQGDRPRTVLDDPETFGLPAGSAVPGFAAMAAARDRRSNGES